MAYISVGSSSAPLLHFLDEWNLDNLENDISPADIPNASKIFVNGNWVGIHRDANHLVSLSCLLLDVWYLYLDLNHVHSHQGTSQSMNF